MAGIEDFVVEQILQDFQNAPLPQAAAPTAQPQAAAQPQQPQQSFRVHGVDFTPQQFDAYVQSPLPGQQDIPLAQRRTVGQQATTEYRQQEKERVGALNKRDSARATIMQGIRGLDPQIQSTILRRLGLDAGPIKSQIDQQKELLQFRQQLEAPQQQALNAIKMMMAGHEQQKFAQTQDFKERELQANTTGRADTRNIQLMRILATMMSVKPELEKTLGPILMQMMQGAGINLQPPPAAAAGASAGSRATTGRKITQVE